MGMLIYTRSVQANISANSGYFYVGSFIIITTSKLGRGADRRVEGRLAVILTYSSLNSVKKAGCKDLQSVRVGTPAESRRHSWH